MHVVFTGGSTGFSTGTAHSLRRRRWKSTQSRVARTATSPGEAVGVVNRRLAASSAEKGGSAAPATVWIWLMAVTANPWFGLPTLNTSAFSVSPMLTKGEGNTPGTWAPWLSVRPMESRADGPWLDALSSHSTSKE